jgi:hypothetical protein
MWICPACRRPFAVKNVLHSCFRGDVDKHFKDKPASLRKAYNKLETALLKFGDTNISPVKTAIYFKRAGTFCGVAVKKDHFKVSFFLPERTDIFPIEKSVQYTKQKHAHYVSVAEVGDVTPQLVKWVRISYGLAKS